MRAKYLYLLPILTLLIAGLACGRESPPILPPADQQPPAGVETATPDS